MVKRALEGLDGVRRAEVSFRDREARVVYDPAHVSVDAMVDAVNRLGFRASVKRNEAER